MLLQGLSSRSNAGHGSQRDFAQFESDDNTRIKTLNEEKGSGLQREMENDDASHTWLATTRQTGRRHRPWWLLALNRAGAASGLISDSSPDSAFCQELSSLSRLSTINKHPHSLSTNKVEPALTSTSKQW
jgi:hypothetical protein